MNGYNDKDVAFDYDNLLRQHKWQALVIQASLDNFINLYHLRIVALVSALFYNVLTLIRSLNRPALFLCFFFGRNPGHRQFRNSCNG